ncbi:MAG: hypothetical protein H6704_20005 [Myxococcales bacterium]|nr:hypothetical protein [Myxococcales bacterium]
MLFRIEDLAAMSAAAPAAAPAALEPEPADALALMAPRRWSPRGRARAAGAGPWRWVGWRSRRRRWP